MHLQKQTDCVHWIKSNKLIQIKIIKMCVLCAYDTWCGILNGNTD